MRYAPALRSLLGFIVVLLPAVTHAIPSVLHYQGVLTDGSGTPITTTTSVTFTLWNQPSNGTVKWTEPRTVTPDSEGRFAILLGQAVPLHDSVFEFPPLYLGVQVGAGPELTPRALLSSQAYAFRIATIDGATGGFISGYTEIESNVADSGLGIKDPGGNVGGVTPTSTFFEDNTGERLVELGTVGLYFVDPSTGDTVFLYDPFLNSLSIGVGNQMNAFSSIALGFNNTVSGVGNSVFGSNNTVSSGNSIAVGTTNVVTSGESCAIGSGNAVDSGAYAFAVGTDNRARGLRSFVCGLQNAAHGVASGVFGGRDNTVSGTNSSNATIVGGINNRASGPEAFIGGGQSNIVTAQQAAIVGGAGNIASGLWSGIFSGAGNKARGIYNFIGAGSSCSTSADGACIVGGSSNEAQGSYSFIGGGLGNGTLSPAGSSFVGGGYFNNTLGRYTSIVGGTLNAVYDTAGFVGGGTNNQCHGVNSVITGGSSNLALGNYATIPGGLSNYIGGNFAFAAGRRARATNPGSFVWGDATDADVSSAAANDFTVRASGGVNIYSNASLTAGVTLAAGGGSWASVSDRNVKENIEPVNGEEVLAKLADIPIAEWNYTSQNEDIRHIGPMAQDFYAAFGLGEDNRHITTIDADGIALAAIQELTKQVRELKAEIARLKNQN